MSRTALVKTLKGKVKNSEEIPSSFYLTDKERHEKNELLETGFQWNKNDFNKFLRGCEKFGRCAFAQISQMMGNKDEEEVEKYSEAFWKDVTILPNYEKIVKNIEKGEEKIEQRERAISLVIIKAKKIHMI